MAQRLITRRGSHCWDFLTTFVASRRVFMSIYRRYERRVLKAARERGLNRSELRLPPKELVKLFHQVRLDRLRDYRLGPLRDLAVRIFGDGGDEGLMDAYCGHIYHEISILAEEHRSVGRFVRHHDPRRYRALYEEVSGYYPLRLNRVLRLFRAAMKRLDELLPRWSREKVIVRSVYLFGQPLARRAYGNGREALYLRMYPSGGVIRGYLEAGRSFYRSGFAEQARGALTSAIAVFERGNGGRDIPREEQRAAEEARELLAHLVGAQPGPGTRT